MILARDVREEHRWLTLFEGAVWTVGDLAMHDLKTLQGLEWLCHIETWQRAWERLRTDFPDTYEAFRAA